MRELLICAALCFVTLVCIVEVHTETCGGMATNCTHVVCGSNAVNSCIDNICTCKDTTPGRACADDHDCHEFFGKEACHHHGNHWSCQSDSRCHCFHGHDEIAIPN